MLDVRPETGADHDAIWHVHERAFAPSIGEAKLVEELRAAGDLVPELCLVAEEGGEVVGHIAYSRARLESGHEVPALAPMAVLPERQRGGIGLALVRESLDRAAGTEFPSLWCWATPTTTRASGSSRAPLTGSSTRMGCRRRRGWCTCCPPTRPPRAAS